MGFLDRLFGRREEPEPQPEQRRPPRRGQSPEEMTDEQAVERYRYMLRTAPPDAVEQAHAEAFARLTPEQRRMVLDELSREVPESERATSDDPKSLARMATRAEMRQPGTMERTFNNVGGGTGGGGMSMGGMMAGSFFSSMAGMFVGSMIFNSFFGHNDYGQQYNESSEGGGGGDGSGSDGGDGGDTGDSGSGDAGSSDGGVGDYGGDYGGGDFGGGDFGGGDFGGGDF